MEIVEVKTSELIGPALDWAVGRVEALPIEFCDSDFDEERHYCFLNRSVFDSRGVRTFCSGSIWFPSTNWSQGGPLVEKLLATGKWEVVQGAKDGTVWVQNYDKDCVPVDGESWDQRNMYFESESLLIAACRAIVAAKLGDTVSVPAELITNG